MSKENMMWVEKYRPQTIAECILPEGVKKQALGMVGKGNLSNLILAGMQGTGKTTLAKAICNEYGGDYIVYNGSDGSLNLEELRQGIDDYANTTSLDGSGKLKIIIIDEADGLGHLIQPALRNAIEKYHKTTRFILTCNYPDKIIGPLHSRCAMIDYKFSKDEMNGLVRQFAMRVVEILQAEGITYDVEAVKAVILRFFPDNRKILNELQKYANENGTIDEGIIEQLKSNVDELFAGIKAKDFSKVKHWLTNNSVGSIFNTLYREGEARIDKGLLPLWILKLGEYQKYHGVVPNQELNVLAALTEFMAES